MCDIDATISATSLEGLFLDETDEKSQPIAGSAGEVMRRIAAWGVPVSRFVERAKKVRDRPYHKHTFFLKLIEMGAYTEAEYERRIERIKRTPEPFQPGKCYCGLALSCPLHSEVH